MRARTWPGSTKSPSSTSMLATRPASLVATSTSVASMRPLPLAKPSPRPFGRSCHQAVAASRATAAASRTAWRDVMLIISASLLNPGCGVFTTCRLSAKWPSGGLMQVKHGRLPQAGAVTPFMFGTVQRLIGLGEQFAWLFVNHRIHYGDADTQGQTPQRTAWVLDIQAGNRRMDACGDLLGALQIGRASCRERVWGPV